MDIIKALLKEKNEEIRPFFEKNRSHCPFFGFFPFEEGFYDQGGGQCPLLFLTDGRYTSCFIEIPDWEKCTSFNDKNQPEKMKKIKKLLEKWRIFPNEFWPPGVRKWKGIKFPRWFSYIMGKKDNDKFDPFNPETWKK